jgi:hypothetical protein
VDDIRDLENRLEADPFPADGVAGLLRTPAKTAKRLHICPGETQLVAINPKPARRVGECHLRCDRGAIGTIVLVLYQLLQKMGWLPIQLGGYPADNELDILEAFVISGC